jgi:hypothetical protein
MAMAAIMVACGLGLRKTRARQDHSVARRAGVISYDDQGRARFARAVETALAGAVETVAASMPEPDTKIDTAIIKTAKQLTTSNSFDITQQRGVMAPMGVPGESYWDPVGFCDDCDLATFRQYRAAELKHGRVCMMATLGLIVQASGTRFNFAWPYESQYSLENAPSGIGVFSEYGPQAAWFGVLILLAGFVEVCLWRQEDDAAPGDFGDFAKFAEQWYQGADSNPQIAKQFEDSELAHGRLAMFAFTGTVVAEYVTGYTAFEQWAHAGEAYEKSMSITVFP